MIKITLKGSPQSTNAIYKTMCRGNFPNRYMSPKAKSLKEDYMWQIKSQYKGKLLAGSLRIAVGLYFGTKRISDWDNFHKLSMDACTGLVWVDDSQIQEAHVIKHYDKENPRIELSIEEYD
tara:strand:+ start:264 stop:626 length:363 start_codon:yes stop_codon:yes gene_type:complete